MRFIVLTCFYAMHVMTPCMHVCHDSMQAEMHPESSGQHPHALSRDVPRRRGGGGGPGVPSHVRLAPGDNVRVGQADHREAVRRSGGQGGGRAPPLQGAVVTGEVVKGRRLGASLTRCGRLCAPDGPGAILAEICRGGSAILVFWIQKCPCFLLLILLGEL